MAQTRTSVAEPAQHTTKVWIGLLAGSLSFERLWFSCRSISPQIVETASIVESEVCFLAFRGSAFHMAAANRNTAGVAGSSTSE